MLPSGTRSAVRGVRSDGGDDDVCCLFTITTGITGGSGGSPLKEGRVDIHVHVMNCCKLKALRKRTHSKQFNSAPEISDLNFVVLL